MNFQKIDRKNWKRAEYFDHYLTALPCTYSMTVKIDITPILQQNLKLYPAMLYALTTIVNRHAEFRTALGPDGEPGIYDRMNPCYTVFHPEEESFSNLWTEYDPDFAVFYQAYLADIRTFGENTGMIGKPDIPVNTFPVSMIPWTCFDSFQLNLQKGYGFLLPIFTMGRYSVSENGQVLLPLSVQVHHAVCDGFHLSRFLEELQQLISSGLQGEEKE